MNGCKNSTILIEKNLQKMHDMVPIRKSGLHNFYVVTKWDSSYLHLSKDDALTQMLPNKLKNCRRLQNNFSLTKYVTIVRSETVPYCNNLATGKLLIRIIYAL